MTKNKANYTPTQALECLQGISKNAFYNDMKNGALSYHEEPWGKKTRRYIEGAELARVYGKKFKPQRLDETLQDVPQKQDATLQQNIKTPPENTNLQVEVDFLKEQLTDKKQTIDDLRKDRDEWKEQAKRLALTYQPNAQATEKPAEGKESFLASQGSKNLSITLYDLLWAFIIAFLCVALVVVTKGYWLPYVNMLAK